MMRVIVIILIMILVAGGGAGGLIMLGVVPNPFNPPEQATGPLSAADKAAQQASKKKFVPPEAAYVLIKMDDMVIPVIVNSRPQRRVMLTARLVATGPETKGAIESGMSRYQNEVLNDLIPYFQTYFENHDNLDPAVIKAKLVKHAKAVYGDAAKDVLLINLFDQSMGRAGQ